MPNFFTLRTVAWRNGKVRLIDQSKLPGRLSYVECSTYSEIAEAIKNMVVRGAPAIGVAAAMGIALAALKSKSTTKIGLLQDLERARKVLERTRPTAVNLPWATRRVLDVARIPGEPKSIVRVVVEEAKRMADEDLETNRTLGRYGAALLRNGDVVLTHCN